MKKIAVVGLGYVGLPLAFLAEKKGFDVIGIDRDKNKLASLRKKVPVIDDEIANERLKKSKVLFTDESSKLADRDIVIICVPTPVDDEKTPDLSIVKSAVGASAKHMREGSLLIIESTINPGVCDEIVIPLIEKVSDHKAGKTIHVAHCPERINPGDPKWSVDNINRVVGADSARGLSLAYDFYTKLIDAKVKKMSSLKEAEAVKIVENSFRDVNIAFVNELAKSFNKLGINVNNVIDGAATKPFSFMPHYPGIGVGGHCIPVDPYYLIQYARENDFVHEFLSLARTINESMPTYSINQLGHALDRKGKKLRGAKIAILGLSYKANVGDDRESPAYRVISILKKKGAIVSTYDPHLPGSSSAKTLKDALSGQDAAVLVTNHKEFLKLKPQELSHLKVLFDGRTALLNQKSSLEKLGVTYLAIGTSNDF
ncbi:MAG TPA: nucleotide sugar dehydrogenase [Candidatus Saccharimonadales bacterium]|nr:nucleotide sugar dehydrogenase [Candidatus Saccharimonadales bacterium]